ILLSPRHHPNAPWRNTGQRLCRSGETTTFPHTAIPNKIQAIVAVRMEMRLSEAGQEARGIATASSPCSELILNRQGPGSGLDSSSTAVDDVERSMTRRRLSRTHGRLPQID